MAIDLGNGASVRVAPPELPTVKVSPPAPPAVTVLPVAGPPGSGGSGLAAVSDGLELVVTVTSNWGVDDDGPYYDADGADPADAAIASLDSDGHLVLTKPAGD